MIYFLLALLNLPHLILTLARMTPYNPQRTGCVGGESTCDSIVRANEQVFFRLRKKGHLHLLLKMQHPVSAVHHGLLKLLVCLIHL